MSDLAHLKIWGDPAIRGSLSWYLDVAENRRLAKFRIAATLATQIDLATSSEDALWAELDRMTSIFLKRWQAIRTGASLPATADGPSLLEVCRELAYRMLAHCNFCPWNCRVDRMAGAKFGACKLASASRVSSHFHHTGEELFYRGTEGSGTIFFTSCNMRCAFCQNGDISTDKDNGEETDPRTLAAMAWTLRLSDEREKDVWDAINQCPLSGVKRASGRRASMSAYDPKRTFAAFCALPGSVENGLKQAPLVGHSF
jgi:putative pyruvate formate lyase activating enzyme